MELLHGVGVERDDGVVIVDGFVDNKSVWRLLPLEDSCAEVLLRFPVNNKKKQSLEERSNSKIETL